MARQYFGTDGVRGIVGEFLTADLVERLGRAATLWSGASRVFVGRDTRGSGPELEAAFARGIVSAGGTAVLGGVLPTPAVALSPLDLGVVLSASHNPPEYNGVKFFDARGRKLPDAVEEEIEALLDAPPTAQEGRGRVRRPAPPRRYLDYVVANFGSDLAGLRIAVDCANGAYSGLAPRGVRAARRDRARDRQRAGRLEHQRRLRRHRHGRTAGGSSRAAASTSASPSTATATACSRSTSAAS